MSDWTIIHGDCLDEMRKMEANSIDAIVTDPPYGLHFMGKDWDSFKQKVTHGFNVPGQPRITGFAKSDGSALAGTYDESRNDEFQAFIACVGREALRICKPGAHLLMCGAPRRFHRQICALEDAGWEIRDCVMWLFGQGFPKSHNFGRKIGGEWAGWGTALKPAYEPIIMAMKPCEGTFAKNAEKWGVAGINIDASRIEGNMEGAHYGGKKISDNRFFPGIAGSGYATIKPQLGRWPANVILDEAAAAMVDEMSGQSKSKGFKQTKNTTGFHHCLGRNAKNRIDDGGHFDSGGASRFYYCPKASSAERGEANNHPTVKPLRLMQYLIRLIMPPKDGILLDPFAGSGSTIVAAKQMGAKAIGIEKCAEYVEIARARVAGASINQQMELFEQETA